MQEFFHEKSQEEILRRLKELKSQDPDYKNGKTFSLVYYLGEDHHNLLSKVYSEMMYENALNTFAFKSLKLMEEEIVKHSITLLNGDASCVGTLTTGGTESILMAVKTYRDKARAEKKHIKKPNIIAPESVHVAFNKACEYFNIELKLAKLDSKTKKVDSNHVERLIDKNTIALIGSAPQYPHGVIDPIEELSSIAQKYNLWLHVDACVGGFLLPYYEMLGLEIPKFDFRIPHVTSISADLHKYAFAPKGASVVLYRSIDFLKYQFFICENFPGGAYASTALMGTKSGGSIAGAWAVLNYYGKKGYLEIAKKTYELTTKFKDAISQIDGLKIVGMPESSLFAYESIDPKINIYAVADVLSKKGYLIDRQQNPESIHAMITPNHEKIFEEYINDLKEAVKIVKENPNLSLSGQAAVYGMVSKLPIRSIVRHEILKILIESYSNTSENLNNKNLETQNTALDHSLPFWQKFILKILMFFKK